MACGTRPLPTSWPALPAAASKPSGSWKP